VSAREKQNATGSYIPWRSMLIGWRNRIAKASRLRFVLGASNRCTGWLLGNKKPRVNTPAA
jgi:hypothetical protein